MDHAVLRANYTMPAFPGKRYQMALPLTDVADIQLQLTNLSTPEGMKG